MSGSKPQPVAPRFWAKVDKEGPVPVDRSDLGSCWVWTGGMTFGGRYGGLSVNGRMRPAHRVGYELERGPIPDGLELDHLCRTTRCVRASHLEPVTHRQNIRRGQGFAGKNARKETCARHGDPLTATKFGRLCRLCRQEDNRAWRRRHGLVRGAA